MTDFPGPGDFGCNSERATCVMREIGRQVMSQTREKCGTRRGQDGRGLNVWLYDGKTYNNNRGFGGGAAAGPSGGRIGWMGTLGRCRTTNDVRAPDSPTVLLLLRTDIIRLQHDGTKARCNGDADHTNMYCTCVRCIHYIWPSFSSS